MSDETIFQGDLLKGKRGLIMGVANDKSIAWGIAQQAHAQGAELAFSYQGEVLEKRVTPLAESVGSNLILECDVTNQDSIDGLFDRLKKEFIQNTYPNKKNIKSEDLVLRMEFKCN